MIAKGAERSGFIPIRSRPRSIRSVRRPTGVQRLRSCSDYGCPIGARVGALATMQLAVQTGRTQFAQHDRHQGQLHRQTGDRRALYRPARAWRGERRSGRTGRVRDRVGALALLADLPDASGRIGARLMFHNFIDGFGIYLDPAGARLPRPLDHAVHGGLRRPRLSRCTSSRRNWPGCPTSAAAFASSAAARTRSPRASSTRRSWGSCRGCSCSAVRSRT